MAEGKKFQYARLADREKAAGNKLVRDEESFTMTFDLSRLDTTQRETLVKSLEGFARGLGPELGGFLAAEGDPHLSHRDTDGWF
jgi:hypothetical protein